MQGDLISRQALLEYMRTTEISQYIDELNNGNYNYSSTPLYDFVKDIPCAYDVEKVVAELNDYYEEKLVIVTPQARERVEDIVRNGGKE